MKLPLAVRLAAFALVCLAHFAGTPALAQAGIKASNASVESKFADHITYSINLQSDADITSATVFVRYHTGEPGATTTRGKADITPSKNLSASFTRKLTRGDLVPGTDIEYYWQIENAAGQTLKTDPQMFSFPDDRFDFKSMSAPVGKGKATVFWYGADQSYGQQRLSVCMAAIEKLQKQIGVELQQEAKIFIYRTRNDMLAALPSKGQTADAFLTVLGELAGPNTVLLLGGDPNVDNTTYHELSHLVVHLATTNPLIGGVNIPAWLDEGLSMYNQQTVESGYTNALNRALQSDSLISVRSLTAVPGQPDQVILFYGESYSLVKYLTETYSKEKMVQLLGVFKRGALVDDALKEVYGFGVQELDNRWRASLGAAPRDASTPSGATQPNPPAQPNQPAQPNPAPAAPFSCACLSGALFLSLWSFIQRSSAT